MTDARAERGSPGPVRISDAVAGLVKQLRSRRSMTVKDLAGRCQELGADHLTANVLTNIEVRRRDVSVDELLVLALALDVAPAHLLTPPEPSTAIAVTATEIHDAGTVEQWVAGTAPLLPAGATSYLQYTAERTVGRGQRLTDHAAALLKARTSGLAEQYEAQAQQFLGNVRRQVLELVDYVEESVTSGVPADDLVQALETIKARVRPQTPISAPTGPAIGGVPGR